MGRFLALIGALLAAALIAWAGERTPPPAPVEASPAEFSASRAMADIRGFASVPHPVGSAANGAARDYLVKRMTALGLSPQVRPGAGVEQSRFVDYVVSGGYVENVVGVLPGRDRSAPALALMAHYDSVPGSTGASDDAAGVATVLEVVRAIAAKGTPARDVIVLLTDGEEAGLLGANAFFHDDPLAKHVGFIINAEARGASGRVQMFQTADRNGGAIRLFGREARRPNASSLAGFVYDHMPNDTDFTVSKAAGAPGLNLAFADNQFDYHSPSSTPATQDPGTLQDMGDQVLGPARAIAFSAALPERTPSLVYANTPGGLFIAYPPVVGWAILAAAAALIGWAVSRARAKEPFAWLDLARGAGAALFAVTTGAVVMHFARTATGAAQGYLQQRFLLAQASRWEAALYLLGLGVMLLSASELSRGKRGVILLPLLAAAGACAFGQIDKVALVTGLVATVIGALTYGRPAGRTGGWAGVLLLGLILAAAAQAYAPAAAFVFAWPVAWAAVAAVLTAAAGHKGLRSLIVNGVFAAVGLSFAAGFFHTAYISLDLVELLALPLLIAAISAWPLAQTEEGAPPARLLGPALILAGLAVTLAVRINHPYDARHPQITIVTYQLDQTRKQGAIVSQAPELPAWTRAALTGEGGKIVRRKEAFNPRLMVDAATAPYFETPATALTLAKSTTGDVTLHVAPPPGGREIDLKLTSDTAATLVGLGGTALHKPMKPGGYTVVRWSAAERGLDVVIHPGGPGQLKATVATTIEQWPPGAKPLPKRPADIAPFDVSGATLLLSSQTFSW